MNAEQLIERLAEKEHASWARWMTYLFSKCEQQADGSMLLPSAMVAHWQQEVEPPYSELSGRYQQSDRDEVAHILPILKENEEQALEPLRHLARDFEAWAMKIAPHSYQDGRAAQSIRERARSLTGETLVSLSRERDE